MTTEQLKRIVTGQAKLAGLPITNLEGIVDDAISLAIPFVWESYVWEFRRKEKDITLTGSQEYVELPGDFGGFISLRYRSGSSTGWKLRYFSEDTYELYYPNPVVLSEDEPRSVKIVKHFNDKWRAYFTPIPDSGYNLTLIYGVDANGAGLDQIGDAYGKLMNIAVWLFMRAPGSQEHIATEAMYQRELIRAIDDINPAHIAEVDNMEAARRFGSYHGEGGDVEDWIRDINCFRW